MSHHSRMLGVVLLGVLFVLSGVGGIVIGGSNAQAGWWLSILGIVLVGLAWRELRVSRPT